MVREIRSLTIERTNNGANSRNANLGNDYVFRSRFSYYMVVYLAMRYTYKVREIGKPRGKRYV